MNGAYYVFEVMIVSSKDVCIELLYTSQITMHSLEPLLAGGEWKLHLVTGILSFDFNVERGLPNYHSTCPPSRSFVFESLRKLMGVEPTRGNVSAALRF